MSEQAGGPALRAVPGGAAAVAEPEMPADDPSKTGLTPPRRRVGSRFISDVIVEMGFLPRERVDQAVEQGKSTGRSAEQVLLDLGDGRVAVREYESVWLERAPVALDRPVTWGRWTLEARVPGLRVRGWRAGDRVGSRKVQDVFVDAKVPRSEREAWPLVVRGDEVVAVPGLAAAPGYEDAVTGTRAGR
jgi:tRNA(Ile)-lysidine synthetase-like protein